MTTHKNDHPGDDDSNSNYNFNEEQNRHEWNVPPAEDNDDKPLLSADKINDCIDILLMPYVPAANEDEATKLFTTNEIISAIERHYGVPQGDPSFNTPDAGLKVVNKLKGLGYSYTNRGNMELEWMMKKKM